MQSHEFIHFVGKCDFLPKDILSHFVALADRMSPEQRKKIVGDLGIHIEEQIQVVDEANHEVARISHTIDITTSSNE